MYIQYGPYIYACIRVYSLNLANINSSIHYCNEGHVFQYN